MGRLYPVAGQSKRSRSLIHLDDPKRQYLSFINLVEAHVLAAIRRHDVKLLKVRDALDYVRRQFRVEHPLINQAFQTDSLDLFVERYGELINASREGQRALKEIIGVYLKQIAWYAKGLPIKLYPFTQATQAVAAPATDPRVVVMNLTISFGRPVIVGAAYPFHLSTSDTMPAIPSRILRITSVWRSVPSKKQSAAKRPDRTVFFIDASLDVDPIRTEFIKAGVFVEIHNDLFARDEDDRIWLRIFGERGWVVLTKDQRLRYRPLEIAALRVSRVRVFALTSGNLLGIEIAAVS